VDAIEPNREDRGVIELQATRPDSPISMSQLDIMQLMKQLLLRVPDDLHRRLAIRAAREGRSVNALATELLDLGAEADLGDRRARLRARAAAAGFLRSIPAPLVAPGERVEVLATTRGLGPVVDVLIAGEREVR